MPDHVLLLTDEDPRLLRQHLGFDLGAWARVLGVAVLTVRRWENGTPPSGLAREVFRGIAAALAAGVSADEIHDRLNLGVGAFLALALDPTKNWKR